MEMTKWLFLGLGILVLVGMVFAQGTSNDDEENGWGEKLQLNKEEFKQKLEENKKQFELKTEEFKNKFEKLKENAKQRLEQYKEKKEKWENKKQGFPGLGIMLDSNDGRALTVQYLQTLGAKVEDHFQKMQDKNQVFADYFELKTQEVNEVLATLDENSTKEQILDAIKQIKGIWEDSQHQRKIIIAEKYVEGVDKVTSKIETALNNLDSKLDKVEAAGIDTNTARIQYSIAVESLANLKLDITATNELLKTKLNDSNTYVVTINELLKKLNDSIHTAKQDVVKAFVEYNKLKNDFVKQNKKDKKEDKEKDVNKQNDDSNSEDDSDEDQEDEVEDESEDDSNN